MKVIIQQLAGAKNEPTCPMMLVELSNDDLAVLIKTGMLETQIFDADAVLCQRYVVVLKGRGINADRLPESR